MLKVKIELIFWTVYVVSWSRGVFWESASFFNHYVLILRGGFPHVSGVCSIFLFSDAVSDGGNVSCTGYHVFLLLDSGCSPSVLLFVQTTNMDPH
jgi:hypothetical protein